MKSNFNADLFGEVKDLNHCNNTNWGMTIWNRTLEGIQNAMKDNVAFYKLMVISNGKYQIRYSLKGFLLHSK